MRVVQNDGYMTKFGKLVIWLWNNQISCVRCHLGRGLPPYQVAPWSVQPFGHNRHGTGELGPHLTQCGRDRGLPPCQVSFWSIQPFAHNMPTSQTDGTTVSMNRLQAVAQKWIGFFTHCTSITRTIIEHKGLNLRHGQSLGGKRTLCDNTK